MLVCFFGCGLCSCGCCRVFLCVFINRRCLIVRNACFIDEVRERLTLCAHIRDRDYRTCVGIVVVIPESLFWNVVLNYLVVEVCQRVTNKSGDFILFYFSLFV